VNAAVFVFVGELNDLLARELRGREVPLTFSEHQSVKHLVESLGVPHVEVGGISLDGQPVELGYRPRNGDRLEVRPAPAGCPIEPRFLLDNHLGRLAASLRMLGFDCLYDNAFTDEQLASALESDPRILLTRDRRLLMRKVVRHGCCLRSLQPRQQIEEVVRRFDLMPAARPFTRCLRCNGLLERVEKDAVLSRLEPKTKLYYDEFARCLSCERIYWRGSHWERMRKAIEAL
jgi:uncharacterized protein with PIN domain